MGLGVSLFFFNTLGYMADSGGLFILIGLFLGACTGFFSFVGIILGGFGIFYSKPIVSIIGMILNLVIFVRALLMLLFFE